MNTIEETYELADAILDHDLDNVKKELGDLLLHVVFYSKMGSEQQAFDIGDVADAICDKLIFRHPHVFGETQAEDAEQVKQNWEDLKLKEKALEHRKKRVLAGVPRSLPALVKAYRIGEKAAAAGFDWEKREDVWEKVKEETAEVQREIDRSDSSRAEEEFGDLFFALVNAARLYGVDPEAALEKSNRRVHPPLHAYRRPGRAAGPFAPRHDARADGCAVERGQGDGKERRERAVAIAPKFLRTASDSRCRAFQSRYPCISA